MTTPSLADLQAQLAATQLEIDRLQLAPLSEIVDAFSTPAIADALAVVEAKLPELTGEAHQQAQNIITVLRNSPQYLKHRRDEINARVNPVPVEDPTTTE